MLSFPVATANPRGQAMSLESITKQIREEISKLNQVLHLLEGRAKKTPRDQGTTTQTINCRQEKDCCCSAGTLGEDQSSQTIERLNLTVRMHLRRYARRNNAHSRTVANHEACMSLA